MTLAAGTKLGRYEIRSKIGAGGMGEVYLAEDTRLHRKVALKILPSELAANKDRMRRFEQEAQAAAALNHPNIAHIYARFSRESLTGLSYTCSISVICGAIRTQHRTRTSMVTISG